MKKARFSRENGPRGILKPPKFFALASLAQETPLVAFSTPKKSFTRFGREESETPFKDFSPAPYSFVCNWTVGAILINS